MSLDSMADILHCMEQEGKEFWEVVLAADMEERQGCGIGRASCRERV